MVLFSRKLLFKFDYLALGLLTGSRLVLHLTSKKSFFSNRSNKTTVGLVSSKLHNRFRAGCCILRGFPLVDHDVDYPSQRYNF